jgi:hypothetical protein
MGRALVGLGRTDAAVQEGLIGVDSYPSISSYIALAAFYAAADRVPEAKAALAEAMKLNPKLSVAWFHARTPSLMDSPPGFLEGLRKAGMPRSDGTLRWPTGAGAMLVACRLSRSIRA